jgi:competence protein ComEC
MVAAGEKERLQATTLKQALKHFHFYCGVVRSALRGHSFRTSTQTTCTGDPGSLTEWPRQVQFFLYTESENALRFASVPLFHMAWLFAAGIYLQSFAYLPFGNLLTVLLLLFFVTVIAAWRVPRWAVAFTCLLWFGLGYLCASIEPVPSTHIRMLGMADNLIRTVEGEVTHVGSVRTENAAGPEGELHSEETQTIDLRVYRVEQVTPETDAMVPMEGGLRLTLYAHQGEALLLPGCGDRVRVDVQMELPSHYADPGVWDRVAYLRQQGIDVLGTAKPSRFAIDQRAKGLSFHCRIQRWQQKASNRLMALVNAGGQRLPVWMRFRREDGAMLTAMITGDRSFLTRSLREGFERTGSFHLLVVSGLHLAIMAGFVFGVAKWLRMPSFLASLATLSLACCYALLTGLGQPVLRSLLMVSIYLFSRLLFREKSALNAIGFAGLCLLVLDPHAVLEAGLQMTLLSVIAIAGIAVPLIECWITPWLKATKMLDEVELDPALPARVAQFRVVLRMYLVRLAYLGGEWLAWRLAPTILRMLLRFAELLIVSAVMELVMTLPMTVYFHRVTLVSLPVNILLVPFVSFLLPLALLTFAMLFFWPSAAIVPASLTAALLHAARGVVQWVGGSSATDIRIAQPTTAIILASIAALALALVLVCVRLSLWGRLTGLTLLVLSAGMVILPHAPRHEESALEVEAIDVGQGDALLLISPDGKTMLVDAGGLMRQSGIGGEESSSANFEIGEDVVSPVLWSRGIRRLDIAVLSHAHNDHMGGLVAILRNFRPKELWVGKNPAIGEYKVLLAEAAQHGVLVKQHLAGEQLSFGETTVSVLAPDLSYVPGPVASNNDSLVLKIRYRNTAVLLEGDAEAPVEGRMVRHGELKSTLLKVGHHGSLSSTTSGFLSAVEPAFGIISVGARNHYEHPRLETLEKLSRAGVQTYRTDLHGTTCFLLDGKRVIAHPMCR